MPRAIGIEECVICGSGVRVESVAAFGGPARKTILGPCRFEICSWHTKARELRDGLKELDTLLRKKKFWADEGDGVLPESFIVGLREEIIFLEKRRQELNQEVEIVIKEAHQRVRRPSNF